MELGLVDELGGYDVALRLIREELGLPDDAALRIKLFLLLVGPLLVALAAALGLSPLRWLDGPSDVETPPKFLSFTRRLTVSPASKRPSPFSSTNSAESADGTAD